jgi:3-oxoacyl-[acyl-carrier-protein] synthase II
MRHRVAVTGLGMVSALGSSLAATWPRLLAGEHGCRPVRRFDASRYASKVAAEVPDWRDEPTGLASLPLAGCRRGVRFFLAAAREAWSDAGFHPGAAPYPVDRVGVAAGTSVNYLHVGELRALWERRDASGRHVDLDAEARSPVMTPWSQVRRTGDWMAASVARALGLGGPQMVVDTACASSAHALLDALRAVRRGEAAAMVAGGGAGLVMPIVVLAFSRIGALSTNPDPETASRPFDRHRDGFVLGEGAGAVVLEDLDAARRRGARIYAELAGGASTINAHSLTDPSPGGETEAATIRLALRDAGMAPGEIDYIAAHGTSTPRNDATETAAIKQALGEAARRVAVSSNKGQLGHTLPAAGVLNAIAAVKAIDTGRVPPTVHYATPDPECDLDYVPDIGRRQAVAGALAHAFAFGGQNVVLAFRAV